MRATVTMALRIFTLGGFRVQHDDTPIPDAAWKTQKNKTLLQLLLTDRKRPLVRDQFFEYLWADLDRASADRNLRVAISQLRRALDPPTALENERRSGQNANTSTYILTTERGYAWNEDAAYWLDADEFERLAEASADLTTYEQARQLYRGDYLEQERYADWAAAERERLREIYFALLTHMADAYARRGQYRRAVSLAREVLAADQCRESVWCQLMLYHYHAGDPALALRAFDECTRALAQELDAGPLPETSALAEQIRQRQLVTEQVYPPPVALERLRQLPVSLGRLTFVGREREWETLVQHWNAACAGSGRVVLIEGEAGVGKTRLAEELLHYAHTQGAVLLQGKGRELGGALPYQPLIDALRSAPEAQRAAEALAPLWRLELARLVPEWNPAGIETLQVGGDPSRLFEALTRLLLDLAAQHSALFLMLDDIHWFDPATLQFLSYWSQRLGAERVLLLATARSDEVEATSPLALWFNQLARNGLLFRMNVLPLSREAIAQLVRDASHASPAAAPLAARVYRETQGYPLFLIALLQSLFDEGLLYADEQGQWHGAETLFTEVGARWNVPRAVHEILTRRVERLDFNVQRLLQTAAVLGQPFDFELLQRALDREETALLEDLEQAVARRLLRASEGTQGITYDLSHDLIRHALYNSLSPERRMRLHQRVFYARESGAGALPSNPAELAYHAQGARLWSKTVEYSLRAAERALESYAIHDALRQCERGLTALDALPATSEPSVTRQRVLWRYDLLAAKQLTLHLRGERDVELLDALLALAQQLGDSERLAKAYHARMRHAIDTGQNNAALDLIPAYEAIIRQGVSTQTAMGFHQRVGFLYYRVGDFMRALEHHDDALRLAQETNDAHWQAYVLNTRGTVLMCLGRYADAIADFSNAADLWQTSARQIFRTFALDNRADVLQYLGQFEQALATKQDALAQYREFRYPIAEAECLAEMGAALRELGRTEEARDFLQQGLALSESLRDSYDLVQSLLGLARLELDGSAVENWVRAEEYAAHAVAEAERAHLPHGVIQGLAYQALARVRLGSAADALELSRRAVEHLAERQHIEGAEEEIYFIHSQVLAANGRSDAARAALAQAYAEMMAKTDLLTDPALRSSFLERVRVNRAIALAHHSPSP